MNDQTNIPLARTLSNNADFQVNSLLFQVRALLWFVQRIQYETRCLTGYENALQFCRETLEHVVMDTQKLLDVSQRLDATLHPELNGVDSYSHAKVNASREDLPF